MCVLLVLLVKQALCRQSGQGPKTCTERSNRHSLAAVRSKRLCAGLLPSRRRELSEEGERMPVWEA